MIKPDQYKEVMRRHATTVVLISVRSAGRIHLMTATAFTPVSIDPPLALFCVHRQNSTHELLHVGSNVGINLLSHRQEPLSRRFASKGPERYEVSDLNLVTGPAGAPLLSDACASMEVKVIEKHSGGDHSIFVGEIAWAVTEKHSSPLVYYSGEYLSVCERTTGQSFGSTAARV